MVANILDNLDSIVSKIQAQTKMSREEINQKIKAKQEEYGGLLTEAGAAFSIAKEHNVRTDSEETTAASSPSESCKIKSLAEAMTSVDVTVKADAVYPTKHFEKGSNKGEVTNVEVSDDSGKTRLVIWGKPEEVKTISKNSTIKISNAYTKKNQERIELHIGNRGAFAVEKAPEKLTKLVDLKDGLDDVDFYARIVRTYPIYEFNKGEKPGKVSSVVVTDGTENRRLVLWNEHADMSKEFAVNEIIKVENAYVRKNNELEVHLGWRGRVLRNQAADIPEVRTERKKITELTDEKDIEIKADVVEIYPPTVIELCAKCKSMMKNGACEKCGSSESVKSVIVNAELDDGTGVIRGTFYRDKAEKLLSLKPDEMSKFDDSKNGILGSQFVFFGEVREVPEYNRKEFIVRRFEQPNYDVEIRKLNEVMQHGEGKN